MEDIERRALMGDEEAQRECTQQGVVLPCPCCKGNARVRYTGNNSGPDGYTSNVYARSKPGLIRCDKCGLKTSRYTKVCRALARWNTRPAPPVGRCKDCTNWDKEQTESILGYECACFALSNEKLGHIVYTQPDGFCNNFDPMEE